jgi:hypothetical protein
LTSDYAESLYSNTNVNDPGQQGSKLNYATLNMMSSNGCGKKGGIKKTDFFKQTEKEPF